MLKNENIHSVEIINEQDRITDLGEIEALIDTAVCGTLKAEGVSEPSEVGNSPFFQETGFLFSAGVSRVRQSPRRISSCRANITASSSGLSNELMNTAVEECIDFKSEEWNPHAKLSKDNAAASCKSSRL